MRIISKNRLLVLSLTKECLKHMKKIGAKSFDIIYFMNTFSLKKEFLYFDKIYYNEETLEKNAKIGKWLSTLFRQDDGNLYDWKMYEIALLKDQGVLIPFQPIPLNSPEECVRFQEDTNVRQTITEMRKVHNKARKALKEFVEGKFDSLQSTFRYSWEYTDMEAILVARCYNFKNSGCVPILQNRDQKCVHDSMLNQALVINTIIKDFPFICVSKEWSEITSYKADPKVQEYLLSLKNWLIDLTKGGLSPEELDDRLSYFKAEYIKHSKFHDLKIKYTNLEKNVLTPLSVIESIVKLNLSEIGKNFLDKKREAIDLKIEEANLKFNEVAYLVNTEKVFDNEKSRLIKRGAQKPIS